MQKQMLELGSNHNSRPVHWIAFSTDSNPSVQSTYKETNAASQN